MLPVYVVLVSYLQHLGPYSVSKTALLGLTKVLAQELGPEGIRVNCIAPGIIKTHFSEAVSDGNIIVSNLKSLISTKVWINSIV